MKSRAICILEPLALAAGFLLFWGALIWAGLRWVDDGAPRPIAREMSR